MIHILQHDAIWCTTSFFPKSTFCRARCYHVFPYFQSMLLRWCIRVFFLFLTRLFHQAYFLSAHGLFHQVYFLSVHGFPRAPASCQAAPLHVCFPRFFVLRVPAFSPLVFYILFIVSWWFFFFFYFASYISICAKPLPVVEAHVFTRYIWVVWQQQRDHAKQESYIGSVVLRPGILVFRYWPGQSRPYCCARTGPSFMGASCAQRSKMDNIKLTISISHSKTWNVHSKIR